jgi:hypothetical protein
MPSTMDDKIRAKAAAAARKRRKPEVPLTRIEASAEAPWDDSFSPAWEQPFRETYADTLAARGEAFVKREKKREKASGSSGTHKNPRRLITMTQQEFDEQDARAEAAGLPWSTWARRKLSEP